MPKKSKPYYIFVPLDEAELDSRAKEGYRIIPGSHFLKGSINMIIMELVSEKE
jgi:hypothetical protein